MHPTPTFDHQKEVADVAISASGDYIATGSSHSVRIWKKTKKGWVKQATLKWPEYAINKIALQGDFIAAASLFSSTRIAVWKKISTGKWKKHKILVNPSLVASFAFSSSSPLLAAGCIDPNNTYLWKLENDSLELIQKISHSGWVRSVAIQSDTRLLTAEKHVAIWQARGKDYSQTGTLNTSLVNSFGILEDTPSSFTLFTATFSSKEVSIWQKKPKKPWKKTTTLAHPWAVQKAQSNGAHHIFTSSGNFIYMWKRTKEWAAVIALKCLEPPRNFSVDNSNTLIFTQGRKAHLYSLNPYLNAYIKLFFSNHPIWLTTRPQGAKHDF